jgi:hypothetical protein
MWRLGSGLHVGDLGLLVSIIFLFLSPCEADEIIFQKQGVQIGTVLEEDDQSVTIRFPRESIGSITKTQEGVPPAITPPPAEAALSETPVEEKIERLEKRIEELEKGRNEGTDAAGSMQPDSSKHPATTEQLMQEEMGRVSGVILWQGNPLAYRSVMIALEKYTGFSWASLKKAFSKDVEASSEEEFILKTQTDSQGHYSFENVPPGHYRLYWMPDAETGWIRRLREKPDFEVVPGNLTIQDIPEKKK